MIDDAHLKLELAARGLTLETSAQHLQSRAAEPVSSLDLVLPGGACVAAAIGGAAPLSLVAEGERYFVLRGEGDGERSRVEVRPVPPPQFYQRRTSRGTPMARIASVRATHLVVTPGGACGFSLQGRPCGFCVEGARGSLDREAVPVSDVIEVVRAAFDESAVASVYFNTAFFDPDDGGIGFLAPYVEAVRRHFDTLVAAQVHPPRGTGWIDRAYAMGVDALSYNLEIFDAEALQRHCVGRARYIGRERYLEALARAAEVFPSGTVWSDLVVGFEPAAATLAGIDALAAVGVVPVVAFVAGGPLVPEPSEVIPVLAQLHRSVKRHGINMGWVRDLALGITPLEARHFAGGGARLAVTVQNLTRSRLGSLAARSLARFRRRLRVHSATSLGSARA